MRTIRFQNDQISDLMERVIANEPKNDNTIANESSDQRIDTAIRRLESVVESSFSRMNNRIDSLESKINCSLIPSECLKNGELSKPLIDVHLIRLMEQIKEVNFKFEFGPKFVNFFLKHRFLSINVNKIFKHSPESSEQLWMRSI